MNNRWKKSENLKAEKHQPLVNNSSNEPHQNHPTGNKTVKHHVDKSTFAQSVSGLIAGFSNVIITFPVYKGMLRQQLSGHLTGAVFSQMRKEGFNYLYRGLGPVLLQKTITSSVMFGSFGYFNHAIEAYSVAPNLLSSHHRRNFVAGGLSGAFEAFLTPFERIQALMIDSKRHMQFKNSYEAVHFVRKIGVRELYRGYSCILIRNSVSSSLWFSLKTKLKEKAVESSNSAPQFKRTRSRELLLDFCTGSLSGAFLSTLFYPVAVAKMNMMAPVGANEPFLSVWGALKLAYEQRGRSVRRMYTGALFNFPRSLLSWGITNAVYEFSLATFFPNG